MIPIHDLASSARVLRGLSTSMIGQYTTTLYMTAAESRVHAGRQMTYHDDLQGRFAPGLRLVDEFVDYMTPEERKFGEHYVTGGFPIHVTDVP